MGIDDTLQINPLGINEIPGPSPADARAIEVEQNKEIAKKITRSQQVGPSTRQQTQSEIINLALLYRSLGGNPFNVRHLPFSVLRDMTTDAMIAYAYYYTIVPLVKAEMFVDSEDSQLASAVDAAFRPINGALIKSFSQSLFYGYSPEVKQWRYGNLSAKYRDKNADNPEEDLDVWTSKSVDALLPREPLALAPENCIPKWDETGAFDGFMYSPVPIPDPMLLGMAQTYGPTVLSGYPIPLEFALWITNEREENFGSIYGSPRTKRVYRYWWTYWFRWALADRSFEKKADPATLVYYPTDEAEGFDVNDPNTEAPTSRKLSNTAIKMGMDARSGSVVAIPGDLMMGDDGKSLAKRKWEIEYLEGGDKFDSLDATFRYLDIMKLRGMLLPEQAFLDSNVTGQGASQRYVATQMGEIYQESQQYLIDTYDEIKNKYIVPQFVAANFPDKINIPVKIKTGGLSAQNDELVKQIVTVIGQKNPRDIPVDIPSLLKQSGIPLLTKTQQDAQFKKELEQAKAREPEEREPTTKKSGSQGYNAGVEKTETGESVYVNGPEIIHLATGGFFDSLPNIPPYQNPTVRSNAMRMRQLMIERYKNQIKTFADRLRDKITMTLADEEEKKKHKYGAGAAQVVAEAAVAAWLADQGKDKAEVTERMREIMNKIVLAAGRASLKQANLDSSVFQPQKLVAWVQEYVDTALASVDHTLREEFITFITDELQSDSDTDKLAQALEDHFMETPQTHADRIARHQTRDAFNMGMLQAASDAGISQVLAHDASDGTNTATDMLCQRRNGKVFTPREAMLEKEHPNGTLYFTFLTTENLSLEITDEIPEHLEVKESPGAYDPATETLYVKSEFADSADNWMLTLGKRLSL